MTTNTAQGVTLTPSSPLRFIIKRLRRGVAEPTSDNWPDSELVALINEGHIAICNSLHYLKTIASFPIVAGQTAYTLPPRCNRVFRVYVDGTRLDPVAYTGVVKGDGYYQVGQTIGFTQVPEASAAWIYYSQQPAPLQINDTPLIPPECYYLLRHYAAWRIMVVQEGSQRIADAQRQLSLYQLGLRRLRGEMTPIGEAAAQQFEIAWEHAR